MPISMIPAVNVRVHDAYVTGEGLLQSVLGAYRRARRFPGMLTGPNLDQTIQWHRNRRGTWGGKLHRVGQSH